MVEFFKYFMSMRSVTNKILSLSHIYKKKMEERPSCFSGISESTYNFNKELPNPNYEAALSPPSSPDIAAFDPPHLLWCNTNMCLFTDRIMIRKLIDWRDLVLLNWKNMCSTVEDRTITVLQISAGVVGLASADGTSDKVSPTNGTALI